MRNVFQQYEESENKLTHALVCSLGEDRRLLRRFVRRFTGRTAPSGPLKIVEQQRPGEEVRREEETSGIPDAWIYTDDGWALLIESKVTAPLKVSQLRRHLATAAHRGFRNATLLAITARDEAADLGREIRLYPWTDVYEWLIREATGSQWAKRCMEYIEILESNLIDNGGLKEGGLTRFSGIPFNQENLYSYLEAKRLLKLAMEALRENAKLKRQLRMDPGAPGRGAITGSSGAGVWDFLRLKDAKRAEVFTQYPHLTLAIEHDRLLAIVTIPNGVRTALRRRLVDLGHQGFSSLLSEVNGRLLKALQGDRGAAPMLIVVQRRYQTQRSAAILDAKLEFDLRTADSKTQKHGKGYVKPQPQWLGATYDALAKKRSNLQLSIGASFSFANSSSVHDWHVIDRIVNTWIACRPLLQAMGLKMPK